MPGLIGIGLSGLRTNQTALSVTGNNVANVSTEGYSRQEVVIGASQETFTGAGYIGQGSEIQTVRRITDEFLVDQVRTDTTLLNEREAVVTQAEAIDNLLASSSTGLSSALSTFFESLQGASDDPTSVPQRQLVITQGENLTARFEALASRMEEQFESVNQELESTVATFNSLAQSLANLNNLIPPAIGAGQGNEPNELLDERDQALRELSALVSVSVVEKGDGSVDIFIGNGQPLVIGSQFAELAAVPSASDPTSLDLAFVQNGVNQVITQDISGGRIGGIIDYRDNELLTAINGLGRIAIVLGDTINEQHALGIDLENDLGSLFFSDINSELVARSRAVPNANNAPPNDQVLRVNILESSELTTDTYELQVSGLNGTDVSIIRASDGETVLQGVLPGIFPATFELDGFQIELEGGTFQNGDRFTIQPTRTGAQDIEMSVSRVEDLAFASPVRADASLGNIGSGTISLGTMLDVQSPLTGQTLPSFETPGSLSPPLLVRFINENVYEVLDNSDPSNPVPLQPPLNNQYYVPGQTTGIFSEDPGQSILSTSGADIASLAAPVASGGGFDNGYGTQNLTILTRDIETGIVTAQVVNLPANSTAEEIEALLSPISGIEANAYTHAQLSNFVDDNDGTTRALTINGQLLEITDPSVSYDADAFADLINADLNLAEQGIYAVSDGTNLQLHSSRGVDLDIEVMGAGDSVQVDKIDPYVGGTVSVATQTVTSGNGLAVGGVIDLKLADGISITADADSVFERAPVAVSSYRGYQFNIAGQPESGDVFTIDFNLGGVSDNRNVLAMAQLETAGLVTGAEITYGEAYAQVVEGIGIVTSQAKLDYEAAQVLLAQSEAAWQSVSGVNLDEEAGRLVQYQAAYNASAQVVSTARELFDVLLNVFR